MIYRVYFILLLLSIGYTKAFSQDKNNKDLYLLFQEDHSKGMLKYPRKHEKVYIIYEYQVPRKKSPYPYQIRLNIKKEAQQFELNKDIVEKKVKGLDWIWKDGSAGLANLNFIGYKDFPYKHVYIVEKDKLGKYYAVEVESYIGVDCYY